MENANYDRGAVPYITISVPGLSLLALVEVFPEGIVGLLQL